MFPDCAFDLVTAFETVYFWPNVEKSFANIFRVIKPGGRFLIVNGSTGADKASVKYARMIDGMSLYTAERLEALLVSSGFSKPEIRKAKGKPWIAVVANKSIEKLPRTNQAKNRRNYVETGL